MQPIHDDKKKSNRRRQTFDEPQEPHELGRNLPTLHQIFKYLSNNATFKSLHQHLIQWQDNNGVFHLMQEHYIAI